MNEASRMLIAGTLFTTGRAGNGRMEDHESLVSFGLKLH